MIRTIKKQFAMQWKEWLIGLGMILIIGIMGIVSAQLIIFSDGEMKRYVTIGGVFAVMGLVIWCFATTLQFQYGFNISIAMGNTRKSFLFSYYVVVLIGNLIGVLIAGIICRIEEGVYLSQYPQLTGADNIIISEYIVKYGLLGAFILTGAAGFLGALLVKFGKKAGWILWTVWMFFCLGMPRLLEAAEDAPGSVIGKIGSVMLKFIHGITETKLTIAGIVMVVICLIGTYGIIRKQQVTV